MYKDKQKQKAANKVASKRARDKRRGMTQGMTADKGMTKPVETTGMTGSNKGMTGMTNIQSIVGNTLVVPTSKRQSCRPVTQSDIDALPSYITDAISVTCGYRERLGLADDHNERLERAAHYRILFPNR